MSNFLAMLQQQRQQPAPSLLPDFSGIAQGLMSGYDQGLQDRRQRLADERQRAADAQAAEDRQRKLAGEKLDAGNKYIQALRAVGLNDQAANYFNQTQRGLMEQQTGALPPELVGTPQSRAYDVNTHLPMPELGNIPGGNSFNNPKTLGLLDAFSGYKAPQPKYEQEDPYKNTVRIDPITGARTVVQPGQPRPQTGTTYGQPFVDPNTGSQMQTGSNGRVVPVGGQIGGRGDESAEDYAGYLTNRYGIKFGQGSIYRPAGTIPGETGVHATHKALDVPISPTSPQGQAIIADAHAAGYYTYTKPHGTGPHIHIETNRNPDGTMKAKGGGSAKGAMTWGDPYVDQNGNTVQESSTGSIKVLQKAGKDTASSNIMTDKQIDTEARAQASFEADQYASTEQKKALFDQKRTQLRQERDALVRQQKDAAKRAQPKTGPSKADLLLKRLEAL